MRKVLTVGGVVLLVCLFVVVLSACGGGSYTDTSDGGLTDAEVDRLALDMAWDQMGPADQAEICQGVDVFGLDLAVDIMTSETPSINPTLARNKLSKECL
jgi:hypothetical protein